MGGKHFNSSALQKRKGATSAPSDPQRTNPRTGVNFHRGGAEGARGAHNSEVVGSNPTSGIFLHVEWGGAPLSFSKKNEMLSPAFNRIQRTNHQSADG